MARRRTGALSFAVICVLATACAHPGSTEARAPTPRAATAIALSVLDQSIYLIDPETGARAEVVGRLGDFRSGYAAWSPDHAVLAYGNAGIYLLDFSRPKPRSLIPGEDLSMPAWSPSGQVLAYGNGASLWITTLVELRPYQIPIPATLAPLAMDWSTEGIAFQGIRRDCHRSYLCPTTNDSDIWTVQADGSGLTRVTRIRRALAPKWSPDGASILFIRKFPADRLELWVVGPDGSDPRQVGTARDVVAADWSSDGKRIVMARRGSDGTTLSLWITDSNGENARQLGGPVPGAEATLDW